MNQDSIRNSVNIVLKEVFYEQEDQGQLEMNPKVKQEPKAVRFNTGTEDEYIVTFSERGFLIGDTRMSFEEIENALSKEYTITTKDGTHLDAVKMQQILKYKDTF